MIKRGNKKADSNMSWFIIGFVLVIIVAVLLISFLTKGTFSWNDFTSGFISKDNVDIMRNGCLTACGSGARSAWCSEQREVRFKATQNNPEKDEGSVKASSYFKEGQLLTIKITCENWANGKFPTSPQDPKINATSEEAKKVLGQLSSCSNIPIC